MRLTIDLNSERETVCLAESLLALAPERGVVSLNGTLGAGKTRLVQAVAAAAGVERREVGSPTFVLCRTYRGARTLHHVDAYRIVDEDEFWELGPEEWFESRALTWIEWGERVAGCLPANRLQLTLEVTGAARRRAVIEAAAPPWCDVVAHLEEAFFARKAALPEIQ